MQASAVLTTAYPVSEDVANTASQPSALATYQYFFTAS